MNVQTKLLPLIENVDYSIVNNELVAIAKTREVEQIIHHEAIAEVVGVPAHDIIPAEFDAQGNEISPAQPAQEAIIAVAGQAAYDETILVDEQYFEAIPSMSEVKLSCIADMALAVEEYLSDKAELRDPENDSINIVDGRIFSWGFANIPQPSVDELYNAYLAKLPKVAQEEINAAAKKYLADTDWYVTRFAETQVAIPAEISAERAAARARIA